jgi:putative membrane protein
MKRNIAIFAFLCLVVAIYGMQPTVAHAKAEKQGSGASSGTGAGGSTTGSLSASDKKFVKDAAMGGMMEVQLGQMAQQKAESSDVKDFGSRMEKDHSSANSQLQTLASQKNITLPTKLDSKHKSMVTKLSGESGSAFDKAYMSDMVKDHTEDVAKFKKAAKDLTDPDLKNWAETTLPTLEQHLDLAKNTAQKVGVAATTSSSSHQ